MASVARTEFVVGNVGKVYELRRVGSDNKAVIDFSVAVTPRVRNAKTNEWEDGQVSWVNCTAWGRLAENIEKSFESGTRVILRGEIKDKPAYTKDDGTEIPAKPQLVIDFAGVEITFDPAHSDRVAKGAKSESTPAKKTAPAPAPKKKQAPVATESLDDLDDLDFDSDEPF